MKIGLLSDTHDFFDPRLPGLLAGVDRIVHAGDIGRPAIIRQLENLAPVTAVLGNNDAFPDWPETAVVTWEGVKILVHHIIRPGGQWESIDHRIASEKPAVVVFGHTHRAQQQQVGPTLFVNPGYAGRPRRGTQRSVALLHLKPEIRVEFLELPDTLPLPLP